MMNYHQVTLVVALLSLLGTSTRAQECAANGECDTHERCAVWKEEGECLRNIAYMKEFCPVTCLNAELTQTDGECKDLHPRCYLWEELGECEENSIEMNKFCPKSCEVCPEDLEARGLEEDLCEDQHANCVYWSNHGECKSNKRWMSANCAQSCETCETLKPRRQRVAKAKQSGGDSANDDILSLTEDFGIQQSAEGSQSDETVEVAKKSVEYMTGSIVADLSLKVRENCMNRNELCAFWAVIGECENNKAYMKTNCAPSCMSCHLIDIAARCPPLGDDVEPALQPGDLNKMFERIIRTAPGNRTLTVDEKKELLDSGMTEYSIVVHSQPSDKVADEVSIVVDKSLPPWVITFENFLTPEECDELIKLGYEYKYERSEDVGAINFDGTHEGIQNDRRTSENAWCSTFHGCRGKEVPERVHRRMSKVMQIPVNNSEDLQILKYEKGQFYRTHHDFIPHQAERHCGVRVLTFFLYLSDVDAGGGTNFPQLELTVNPKKGRALLWPSVYDSDPGTKDPRLYHQALEVEAGTKFSANGWIHMYDYVTSQEQGCN